MFCPKCGATNDDTSKFCLGCGSPLDQPAVTPPPSAAPPPAPTYYQPPPPAAPVKKGHTGLIVVIVLILVLAIGATGIIIWAPWKKVNTNNGNNKETTNHSATTTKVTQSEKDTTKADSNEDTTYLPGNAWPTGGLYSKLPKPNFGSVLAQMESQSDGTAYAMLQGVSQTNYDSYISDLKSAGFDNDINTGTIYGQFFTAYNDSNEYIYVIFSPEAATIAITLDVTP